MPLGSILPVFLSACSDYGVHGTDAVARPDTNPSELVATEHVDRISALERPPVDILFLVDDSCSMLDDQERLMREVPRLLATVVREGLDLHVGVTTTSCMPLDRCGAVEWLSSDDGVDVVAGVSSLIAVGASPWTIEEGTRALKQAFDRPENAEFFRPDAPLHIVAISDEPDSSQPKQPSRFTNVLAALPKRVTFSSIARLSADDSLVEGCSAVYGSTYVELARAFPGELVDICAEDWSPVMDRIAEGFGTWEPHFGLSRLPVPETLDVTIETDDGVVIVPEPDEWSYDARANAVTFEAWLGEYVVAGTAVLAYEIRR